MDLSDVGDSRESLVLSCCKRVHTFVVVLVVDMGCRWKAKDMVMGIL